MRKKFSSDLMQFGIAIEHTFLTFKTVFNKKPERFNTIDEIIVLYKKEFKPITKDLIKTN